MQNHITNKLVLAAEKQKQSAVIGIALFAVLAMSLGTVQISSAATSADANVAQEVASGSLSLDAAPSQVTFNSGTPGATTTANTTTNGVVTNDTRGTLAGWEVTGYFNTDFFSAATPADQMAIGSQMSWYPAGGTITPVTGDAGGAIAGANNTFDGITATNSLTLIQHNSGATNNGAGAYNLTNLKFNFAIPISATPHTDYKVNLRLTIA